MCFPVIALTGPSRQQAIHLPDHILQHLSARHRDKWLIHIVFETCNGQQQHRHAVLEVMGNSLCLRAADACFPCFGPLKQTLRSTLSGGWQVENRTRKYRPSKRFQPFMLLTFNSTI